MKMGVWIVKSLLTVFICVLLITACTSNCYGQSKFKCKKEYRLTTKDGMVYQGKLFKNTDDSLTLHKGEEITIALSNVESTYSIKRQTFLGIILGSAIGTGIGMYIANQWEEKQPQSDFYVPWGELVAMTLGGTIVGGFIGGMIGHNISSETEVKLEMLPLCSSSSGNIVPLKLNLVINF
jgi:hypothetical protein